MSSWTHSVQANEMAHFSTTRTLSDFPLLIGEMLRRGNLRACRQARRRTLIRKIKATFGSLDQSGREFFFGRANDRSCESN